MQAQAQKHNLTCQCFAFFALSVSSANASSAHHKPLRILTYFAAPSLHARPEKQAATHLRVKVYNKTNSDHVDQFTTAAVPTGNYEVTKVNSYEISNIDDFKYQVFYKGNGEDNDETPLSATGTSHYQ